MRLDIKTIQMKKLDVEINPVQFGIKVYDDSGENGYLNTFFSREDLEKEIEENGILELVVEIAGFKELRCYDEIFFNDEELARG